MQALENFIRRISQSLSFRRIKDWVKSLLNEKGFIPMVVILLLLRFNPYGIWHVHENLNLMEINTLSDYDIEEQCHQFNFESFKIYSKIERLQTNFEFSQDYDNQLFSNALMRVKQDTKSEINAAMSLTNNLVKVCVYTQIGLGYINTSYANTSLWFKLQKSDLVYKDGNQLFSHDISALLFISQHSEDMHTCFSLLSNSNTYTVWIAPDSVLNIDFESTDGKTLQTLDLNVKTQSHNLFRIRSGKNSNIGSVGVFVALCFLFLSLNNIRYQRIGILVEPRFSNNKKENASQRRVIKEQAKIFYLLSQNITAIVLLYHISTESWIAYGLVVFHRWFTLLKIWNFTRYFYKFKMRERYSFVKPRTTHKNQKFAKILLLVVYLFSLKYYFEWHLWLFMIPTAKVYILNLILQVSQIFAIAWTRDKPFRSKWHNLKDSISQHLLINYFCLYPYNFIGNETFGMLWPFSLVTYIVVAYAKRYQNIYGTRFFLPNSMRNLVYNYDHYISKDYDLHNLSEEKYPEWDYWMEKLNQPSLLEDKVNSIESISKRHNWDLYIKTSNRKKFHYICFTQHEYENHYLNNLYVPYGEFDD